MTASLTLQEWVRKESISQGRAAKTHWRVEDVWKLEDVLVESHTLRPGSDARWEGSFRVPDSAPCSFGDRDHRLVWSVRAEADRVNRPDWIEASYVIVRP